jgi:hypothetical protein
LYTKDWPFQGKCRNIFVKRISKIKCLLCMEFDINLQHALKDLCIIWVIRSRRMRWWDMWNMWGRGEVHTGFWVGDQREEDNLKDLGVDGRIILKRIFKLWYGETWTGLIWLRTGTGAKLL